MKAEFDLIGEEMNDDVTKAMGILGSYRTVTIEYKKEYLIKLFDKQPQCILDYGCGTGLYDSLLKKTFPDCEILGCDVSAECIKVARKNNPDFHYDVIRTGDTMEFCNLYQNKRINCIFVNCVLHHIPHTNHWDCLNALWSILKAPGKLVVFEMNPYNPLTQYVQYANRAMENKAVLLKPGYLKKMLNKVAGNNSVYLLYTFLTPWRHGVFLTLEHCLASLPFGVQYLAYIEKR
jgi:trans-aconitate methyltransferase